MGWTSCFLNNGNIVGKALDTSYNEGRVCKVVGCKKKIPSLGITASLVMLISYP